jgi:thiol-disulfide isomerase/thioredoxin
MKKRLLIGFVFLALSSSFAQEKLPNIVLKNLDGKSINVSEINTENVTIFSFWATWCVPCINELDAISEEYIDWQDETNVQLYAVAIDNTRTQSRVRPLVNGKGWEYEVLLDTNEEFKRYVNANAVPYLIVVKDGKIVYKHSGYTPGSEIELYQKIKELSK